MLMKPIFWTPCAYTLKTHWWCFFYSFPLSVRCWLLYTFPCLWSCQLQCLLYFSQEQKQTPLQQQQLQFWPKANQGQWLITCSIQHFEGPPKQTIPLHWPHRRENTIQCCQPALCPSVWSWDFGIHKFINQIFDTPVPRSAGVQQLQPAEGCAPPHRAASPRLLLHKEWRRGEKMERTFANRWVRAGICNVDIVLQYGKRKRWNLRWKPKSRFWDCQMLANSLMAFIREGFFSAVENETPGSLGEERRG